MTTVSNKKIPNDTHVPPYKFVTPIVGVLCYTAAIVPFVLNTCWQHDSAATLYGSVIGLFSGWFLLTISIDAYYSSFHKCCNQHERKIRCLITTTLYLSMSATGNFYTYYTLKRDALNFLPTLVSFLLAFAIHISVFWTRQFKCGSDAAHCEEHEATPRKVMIATDVFWVLIWLILAIVMAVYNGELTDGTISPLCDA